MSFSSFTLSHNTLLHCLELLIEEDVLLRTTFAFSLCTWWPTTCMELLVGDLCICFTCSLDFRPRVGPLLIIFRPCCYSLLSHCSGYPCPCYVCLLPPSSDCCDRFLNPSPSVCTSSPYCPPKKIQKNSTYNMYISVHLMLLCFVIVHIMLLWVDVEPKASNWLMISCKTKLVHYSIVLVIKLLTVSDPSLHPHGVCFTSSTTFDFS